MYECLRFAVLGDFFKKKRTERASMSFVRSIGHTQRWKFSSAVVKQHLSRSSVPSSPEEEVLPVVGALPLKLLTRQSPDDCCSFMFELGSALCFCIFVCV